MKKALFSNIFFFLCLPASIFCLPVTDHPAFFHESSCLAFSVSNDHSPFSEITNRGRVALDSSTPLVILPTEPRFCGLDTNLVHFWNADYWSDPRLNSQDLMEAACDLSITVEEACSSGPLAIQYQLLLDLDGSDTLETILESGALPGINQLFYNNLNTPSYAGGEAREFDFRPVAEDQKWGFGIQVLSSVPGQWTARVRWLNQLGEDTIPQLPYGKHLIRWRLQSACGLETTYEQAFEVVDCSAPQVLCKQNGSFNIISHSFQAARVLTTDLLALAYDNYSPTSELEFSMRIANTGTDFPLNPDGSPVEYIDFGCLEYGYQYVDLWAKDPTGNPNFCRSKIIVEDTNQICCLIEHSFVSGEILNGLGQAVQDVTVGMNTTVSSLPIGLESVTNAWGKYFFGYVVPFYSELTIAPSSDLDPLNGVNTWDLYLISRHILGLIPLNDPFKLIAADANKSGTITTLDIAELRKLILGTLTELPHQQSWRFLPATHVFTNPTNPFLDALPEVIRDTTLAQTSPKINFTGIKIGDVDYSAVSNCLLGSEERTEGTFFVEVEDRQVSVGEEFTVSFESLEQVNAFQFTLQFEALELLEVLPGPQLSLEQFGIFEQALTMAVEGAAVQFKLRFRATNAGSLSQLLRISSKITPAVAFDKGQKSKIALRFHAFETDRPFELFQNVPNPWGQQTRIGFYLPEDGEARLSIFDALGRLLFSEKKQFQKGENQFVVELQSTPTFGKLLYQVETEINRAVRVMVKK